MNHGLETFLSTEMCVCLQRMGVLPMGQQIEEQADFEKIYKNGGLFQTPHLFPLN